jgi:hypothetical protein
MPIKPHPTDPDKMVYVKREYILPKEWVGLTEEETIELALDAFALLDFPVEARLQLQNELVIAMNTPDSRMMLFAALIEAKLKEKNGG